MSLLKKKLDLIIDGEEYVLMFDMKSIAVYQEITQVSFSEGFLSFNF